jgi:hypothetical protein
MGACGGMDRIPESIVIARDTLSGLCLDIDWPPLARIVGSSRPRMKYRSLNGYVSIPLKKFCEPTLPFSSYPELLKTQQFPGFECPEKAEIQGQLAERLLLFTRQRPSGNECL